MNHTPWDRSWILRIRHHFNMQKWKGRTVCRRLACSNWLLRALYQKQEITTYHRWKCKDLRTPKLKSKPRMQLPDRACKVSTLLNTLACKIQTDLKVRNSNRERWTKNLRVLWMKLSKTRKGQWRMSLCLVEKTLPPRWIQIWTSIWSYKLREFIRKLEFISRKFTLSLYYNRAE